ncbi:bifunctional demethylmenaquinone methyltransferase/2-methoxy-6-polyprenyl-1,4-benzoquinol methylase UbiE [Helicobacter sp. MIT 14-3879]|uniref:bifunctional demethylmenaquinone methyltransferase/2-methoxy-6-polyprenyl-1,4-benzoquinol methylase UbiE n=1 Tax=Helicobacter sp. MIT 14-3879 TaxID=2040649 RepID=UPI000E1F2C63|nr:bifunctional demethylmenaquinone methyltransferase/2-methoxy-6-polyprenyl-1,4-benzoquinol methylase UbiE [Helicobacter sp. MIT 14-3879]RDU65451.1 bifunctional demethylmenaquinone methyltransferase/2-methoxy-6-polyprenyl-1,4-benzoquinol methylase UbiE [Helicobacter sp. MIT 14-3879]
MNKQNDIISMFNSIASSYDIANRILSLGVDTRWRKEACSIALNLYTKDKLNILDVACGTGDMILNWLKYTDNIDSIIGIDPSEEMLKIARKKLPNNVVLQNSEAKELKIKDKSIDILSIAYGLRNVVEINLALSEFKRVLKDNGILVILEFSKKENQNIFDKTALFYTKKILPFIGGFISKNYKAYKYLPNSIDDFITLEELGEMLIELGFLVEFKKRYVCNLCSLIIARNI